MQQHTTATRPTAPAAGGGRSRRHASTLCVDLDGTLVAGDLFWEAVMRLLKRQPAMLLLLPLWLLRGKAHLKREVARRVVLDPRSLPYRPEVLALIEQSRADGRMVVLATAADESYAAAVASHLGVFDAVIASDGIGNVTGGRKASELERRFGADGFEYVGNDWADRPAWRHAEQVTVAAGSIRLVRRLTAEFGSLRVLVSGRSFVRSVIRALRPHQWTKNALLIVPIVTAQRILELDLLVDALLAFAAFCLCASAIYVANDLLDIDADRLHPRKRLRPFAAGDLSVPEGLVLGSTLFVTAMLVAVYAVSATLGLVLMVYAATSMAYSLGIKRLPVADVFVLTGLYVLRIFAGGVATGIVISSWLLAFAMFFFLSLALVKRYSELRATTATVEALAARGYRSTDANWIHAVGISAGYMAVLVLALYASAPEVTAIYGSPAFLMWLCPLLLYWVTHTWFKATRGTRSDDPVLEALRDPASYAILGGVVVVLIAAH